MSETVVTEGYNGGSVSAKRGDTLKVQLPEIPTTGYRWTVGSVDTKILALTEDEYHPGGEGIGAGGLRVFRFALTSAGHTNLQCKLSRSWQPASPKALFSVRVTVT